MSTPSCTETTAPYKLPFKLRFKGDGKGTTNSEANSASFNQDEKRSVGSGPSLPERSNADNVKASKILGVAPKTGPRIGPQYQADIPELVPS